MRIAKLLLTLGLITCLFGCKTKSKKNDFKFDGKGYSKGNITYYKNNDNKWVKLFKEEEIYDLTGKQLYHVFYETKNNELRLKVLHTYKYNDDNQLIEMDIDEYVYSKDGKQELSPNKRIEYTYEGTTLIQTTTFSKDYFNNGELKLSRKTEFTYYENNNLKKETVSSYDTNNDTWEEERIEEYTYDSSNNILSHSTSSHSALANFDEVITYEYDANNNVIKETYECTDSEGLTKTETIKTYENNLLKNEKGFDLVTVSDKEICAIDYTYDSNNNVSVKTIRYNGRDAGSLLMAEKNEYKYDSNNELKTETHSLTEEDPYKWRTNKKIEYFTKEYK